MNVTSTSTTDNDTRAIRSQIEARVRAVRDKNVSAVLALYARDVVTFDMVEPLENSGFDALRRRLEQWFGSFTTNIDYELRDVELSVAGNIAFDHHLTHVHGTNRAGATVDMWFRETIGYRKIEGVWKVTHQHSSVPFDMNSGAARVDLKPTMQRS